MNFVVLQLAYRDFEPSALGLIRFLVMTPLMFLTAFAMKAIPKLKRNEWPRVLFAGFMSSGAYMVVFLEGTSRVTASQGAIMLATAPIWIGILALLTKQDKFRWPLVWGVLVAYVGVAMVVLGGDSKAGGSLVGILLCVSAAVVWATSIIALGPVLKEHNPVGVFALSMPIAAVVMVPFGAQSLAHTDFSRVTPTGWFALAYLVFVAGTACFVMYYTAVRAVGPTQAGMIQYIVPVVTAVAQFFVLGSALTVLQILGIAVVLVGVMLARRESKSASQAMEAME